MVTVRLSRAAVDPAADAKFQARAVLANARHAVGRSRMQAGAVVGPVLARA
jgi:hypothetical protein